MKKMLKENNLLFNEIDCDEYLLDDKDNFLYFIKKLIGKEHKIFPIVFETKLQPTIDPTNKRARDLKFQDPYSPFLSKSADSL